MSTDAQACTALMRKGSKSFYLASQLLSPMRKQPVRALYAFCRQADDAIDRAGQRGWAPSPDVALEQLSARLDRIFAGAGLACPVDRALAQTVHNHALPRAPFDALLQGFAWDVAHRRYETLDDVIAYSARVASSVGVLLTLIWGRRDPWVLGRAAELGVAMQLTNIARDVGADAGLGRLYLPRSWFAQARLDPDIWLQRPLASAAVCGMVERLLVCAAPLYRRARAAMPALPWATRLAVDAASRIYADIGRSIAHNQHDSISRRAYVPLPRKLWLAGCAGMGQLRASLAAPHRSTGVPALPQVQFLLDAVR